MTLKNIFTMSLGVALAALVLLFFAHRVFAGTLTNFSYTVSTFGAGETATYEFTYTTETANPNMINYTAWPAGFDLTNSTVTVTVNGTPAPVGEYWNGGNPGGVGAAYIRLVDPTVASGSTVVVSYIDIVNPTSGGTFNFDWLYTADPGGNEIDAPAAVDAIVIEGDEEEVVPFTGTGTGTEVDPYIITTCEQLQEMDNHLDAYFNLGNDIDCAGTQTWNENETEWVDGIVDGTLIPDEYTGVVNNGYAGFQPIGQLDADNGGEGFTGTLDGRGYTINGLWIFRKDSANTGLIGYTTGSTITDITLDTPRVVGQSKTGAFVGYGWGVSLSDLSTNEGMVRAYLAYEGGGIAGHLAEESSAYELTVAGGTVHGSGNVIGGLVGLLADSTVTDSTTSADVDGGEFIGGAFGDISSSTVDNVDAVGDVESNDNENEIVFIVKSGDATGGFAGRIENSNITNSSATGLVTAGGNLTGGFVGRVFFSTITNSSATGLVLADGDSVGGFAGVVDATTLEDVWSTGSVSGVNQVGGFAGGIYCNSPVTRALASGNVTATGNQVGGFVGTDGCEGPGGIYTEVAAHGNVTTSGSYVGGFVGQSYVSTFTDVYAGGDVTAADRLGGFVGEIFAGTLDNVYARGLVTGGVLAEYAGAFAGEVIETEFSDSFVDSDATDQIFICSIGDCTGITSLTTLQAKTLSTYTDAGWDFQDVWIMENPNNDGYPYFQWETGLGEFPTIGLTTQSATNITRDSVTLRATITDGDANAFGFFMGEESFDDNEIPEEGPDVFFDLLELYPISNGNGGLDIVPTPFPYETEFGELTCDTTYYFRPLVYLGLEDALAMGIGPEGSFTTLPCTEEEPRSRKVSSTNASRALAKKAFTDYYAKKASPANPSSEAGALSSELAQQCSADQMLTQNLRAPSRNGGYNAYTRGIVTEINILQTHLNRFGFNAGPVDGIAGPLTDGAIKRMQIFLGTTPDGYVGPITRGLINTSCGTQGLVQ
jgi:hypothetical protein